MQDFGVVQILQPVENVSQNCHFGLHRGLYQPIHGFAKVLPLNVLQNENILLGILEKLIEFINIVRAYFTENSFLVFDGLWGMEPGFFLFANHLGHIDLVAAL